MKKADTTKRAQEKRKGFTKKIGNTTYLNSMLNELGKQGTSAAKAFAEGTGHIKEGGLTMAEAGSPARVENVGTETEAVLKFTIPHGDRGLPGSGGGSGGSFLIALLAYIDRNNKRE